MLVAPAGYGKTTLAEQWVARDSRVGIWYTARSASTDVAALALGIARAATSIIDECDHRLREHLRALPAPAENVQTLAEILSEDLGEWPSNAWLVLDDYHEIAPEPKAEDFIEALAALSPVQFLIASRVRPRWIASKDIMYGDVLELSQVRLRWITPRLQRTCRAYCQSASGTSVAGERMASSHWSRERLRCGDRGRSRQLLCPTRYIRSLLTRSSPRLRSDVQQGLTTLAVAPVLDVEIGKTLLGPDAFESVCAAAARCWTAGGAR